jgi:hypothetical protein
VTPSENLERVRELLKRKATPKAKGQGLARSKRVNPVNKPRLEARHALAFGPCSRLARLSTCVVKTCRSMPPGDPAHVRSRGAGGGDWANVVPMCRAHHSEQHAKGVAQFEADHKLDLAKEAAAIALAVKDHECDDWPELAKGGLRCAVCLKTIKEPRP